MVLAALGLAVALAMLFPVPRASREANAVMDLGHVALFGVLALAAAALVERAGFRRGTAQLVGWTVVTGFGGLMELAQATVGRHPSWQDLWADALGAGAFLWASSLAGWLPGPARRVGWLGVAILIAAAAALPTAVLWDAVVQRRQWPVQADFEQPLEITRWEFINCRAARSTTRARHGGGALRLEFGTAKYSAASFIWPLADWSAYREFVLELWLDPGEPISLYVKVEDLEHNGRMQDRYERPHLLTPGWNRVVIALDDLARAPRDRQLDLRGIMRWQIYTAALAEPRVVYLDVVRLE